MVHTVYGPHKVQPWTDVTWENLNASFGDILRKQAESPRTRNRDDVDAEKLTIYEEDSVTVLAADWNQKIVQHSLDGTRKPLMASEFKQYLASGTVHFVKNTGVGHILDEKGNRQKPDWCIYQKEQDISNKDKHTYLVPGDSKPATKWQSEWIECDNKSLKRKASSVIQQLTKYMFLAQTRYGFVISEEELVPLRLSTFDRSPETLDARIEEKQARQILDSAYVESEEEEWFEQGIILQPNQKLAESLANVNTKTGFLLEYCRVPWEMHGNGALTINLTLWWLPMLAVQDSAIYETQAYKPLDHNALANKHSLDNQQAAAEANVKILGVQTRGRPKRKAQEFDWRAKKPKSRRTSVNLDSSDGHIASHSRSFASTRSGRFSRDNYTVSEPAADLTLPSENMFSRRSRRKTDKDKPAIADSFKSVLSSSQATDSVAVSFASSL